ncbi:MAG: TolC family protein [Deltaproteobacteria bacterium]|nr:TolC family protein [Deltaproteobacteria bacterium]
MNKYPGKNNINKLIISVFIITGIFFAYMFFFPKVKTAVAATFNSFKGFHTSFAPSDAVPPAKASSVTSAGFNAEKFQTVKVKISLAYAIKRALSNQENILKAEHLIKEKIDIKKAAYAGILPGVAISGGGIWTKMKNGYPFFASANGMRELIGVVNLTVPIFSPKKYAAISLASSKIKTAKYRLKLARLFASATITQEFYELAMLKNEKKIKQTALNNSKKILDAAKIKYKSGSIPRFDVVQTELMADKLKTDLEVLESEINSLKRVFLMDIFYNNISHTKLSLILPRRNVRSKNNLPLLTTLISTAFKKQPMIKIARTEIKSASAMIGINKAARLPSIQGGAAYGEDTVNSFDIPNIGWQVFVSLNIPVFNFGLHGDYIDAANERLMALKYEESAVKLSVKKRLARDYGIAKASKKRILWTKILVKKSAEAFKMTEEGYLAGAFNALELQQSQDNLIKSRVELAKAINDYYLDMAQLDIDTGIIPTGDGKL